MAKKPASKTEANKPTTKQMEQFRAMAADKVSIDIVIRNKTTHYAVPIEDADKSQILAIASRNIADAAYAASKAKAMKTRVEPTSDPAMMPTPDTAPEAA